MENIISKHKKSGFTKEQKQQLDSIGGLLKLIAAALIVIIGIQYIATDLIAPILLAIFLAILLMPIFRFYRTKGLQRGWALFFTLLTLILVGFGLIYFVSWSFVVLRESLGEYTDGFLGSLEELTSRFGLSDETSNTLSEYITPEAVLGFIGSLLSRFGSLAMYFIVVPVLAILLLLQVDSVPKEAADKLIDQNPNLSKYSKFADSVMVYVRSRFKVNFATGALFAISLAFLGIDFAWLWGLITIFLSFVPYVGIVIAAVPPTLLAFAEYGAWGAIMVVVCVAVINLLAENILEPVVQGKDNKISAAAVVISVIFWGWLLGWVGLILAAPLTVLLKVILADYKETAWIASLIEGDYSKIPDREDQKEGRFGKVLHGLKSIFPGGNKKEEE